MYNVLKQLFPNLISEPKKSMKINSHKQAQKTFFDYFNFILGHFIALKHHHHHHGKRILNKVLSR